jgi:uncharacterized phage-associated protein
MNSSTIELERERVITIDEIKLILEQYRIGKKPLAKLLGWGETTIIRYIEGDIPTNEYSSKLKTILEDPQFYYELLCKKKEYLTGVAFKKSKHAVLSKLMATKIYASAYYIINRSGADMCAGYLQYLLYYTQAFSLAFYDTEVFQEEYGINSEHMPYVKLYNAMKRCGIHTLEGVEEFLTSQEKELIEAVIDSFGWYGPNALYALTTLEKSMIPISRDKYNNKIISKESIKKYFVDVLAQYQINSIKELNKYPDIKITEIKEFYK